MLARLALIAVAWWTWSLPAAVRADDVDDALAAIALAGPNSGGSAAARLASDRLVQQGTEILPRLLTALDTDNPVAANWCRTVFEEVVARELAVAKPDLPVAFFKEFAADPQRQGKSRRLVLRLLDRLEPGFRGELVAGLLDDPEFRGDAVALALIAGDHFKSDGNLDEARQKYQMAFAAARDAGQVTAAAGKLRDAGGEADIAKALGLVIDWYFVGPFPAEGYSGFGRAFPPETSPQVDLAAGYSREPGKRIGWKRYSTPDGLGQVNLTQAIALAAEAVGYGYSEIESENEQQVQVRGGADDNLTVWVNGEQILAREQWLNGTRFDRFMAPATLKAGKNRLLVKVCQGPQHKDPAVPNNWSLQLRLCDQSGAGAPFRSLLPPIQEGQK